MRAPALVRARRARRELERSERDAGIAVGDADERFERVFIERDLLGAEAAFGIGERAPHEQRDVVIGERLQHEHARS